MTRRLDPDAAICKLRWAQTQLRVVRDNITPAIAPRTARRIRLALSSVGGAIRNAERRASSATVSAMTRRPK